MLYLQTKQGYFKLEIALFLSISPLLHKIKTYVLIFHESFLTFVKLPH